MTPKFLKIVEAAWFVIGVVALGVAVYEISQRGFEDGWYFLMLPAIAFAWWLFRRSFRRRMERNMQR